MNYLEELTNTGLRRSEGMAASISPMILQIRNIPTVFFMKADAQSQKTVGAQDEAYYRSIIDKMLSE